MPSPVSGLDDSPSGCQYLGKILLRDPDISRGFKFPDGNTFSLNIPLHSRCEGLLDRSVPLSQWCDLPTSRGSDASRLQLMPHPLAC